MYLEGTAFLLVSATPCGGLKKIVCYCSVGYRSSTLAQQLGEELLKPKHQAIRSILELYNLEGSIFKWANEGKDLVDSNGEKTVVVHPYNFVWGKLLRHELRSSQPRGAMCKEQESSQLDSTPNNKSNLW